MSASEARLDCLLTPEEVCALLKIKRQRLYEWVHFKKIPYLKVGRFLRFSQEELMNWINANSSAIIMRNDSPRS